MRNSVVQNVAQAFDLPTRLDPRATETPARLICGPEPSRALDPHPRRPRPSTRPKVTQAPCYKRSPPETHRLLEGATPPSSSTQIAWQYFPPQTQAACAKPSLSRPKATPTAPLAQSLSMEAVCPTQTGARLSADHMGPAAFTKVLLDA